MINNRYKILKLIGEGRSKVFLCSYNDSSFQFALKILSPTGSDEEKLFFKKEFYLLNKCNHHNIIRVNKFGSVFSSSDERISFGSPFIMQEYFDGKSLYEAALNKDETWIKQVTIAILDTLHYLHQSNYVFNDLKGSNILVRDKNGSPEIKLIDFGLVSHISEIQNNKKGTAEYLAPELLHNQTIDYRLDYFTLGVILYRIVFGNYPFKGKNAIEVYHSHIHNKIDFPKNNFTDSFIDVIIRLLNKNPDQRYSSVSQIISNFNEIPPADLFTHSTIIPVFTGRNEELTLINHYIHDKSENNLVLISGNDGSGKTSLLENLAQAYEKTIIIKYGSYRNDLWKYLIDEFYYASLTKDVDNTFYSIDSENESNNPVERVKAIVTKLTQQNKFILLIDDYDKLKGNEIELFFSIIPILLLNGSKVILSVTVYSTELENDFPPHLYIELKELMEENIDEFLAYNLNRTLPVENIKELLTTYSDFLPGSIVNFINDLLTSGMLEHSTEKITLQIDNEKSETLNQLTGNRYALKYGGLTLAEKKMCEQLSLFLLPVSGKEFTKVLTGNLITEATITSLQKKNIIYEDSFTGEIYFISTGFKKYIYSTLKNVKKYHKEVINKLDTKEVTISLEELANQYECADDYNNAYKVYLRILQLPDKQFNFTFQKELLTRIINFPIDKESISNSTLLLIKVYINIGEFKNALDYINNLYEINPDYKLDTEIKVMQGNSLVRLGSIEKGKELLISLLPFMKDGKAKQQLLVDVASAEFEFNNYNEVRRLCNMVVKENIVGTESVGKAYTLLAMSEFFQNENTEGAIKYFLNAKNIYEKAGLFLKVAQMEMNLGNIYNVQGKDKLAEDFFDSSIKKNVEMGSIEQEANLHNNLGVIKFERGHYDETVEHYKRAELIYQALGQSRGQGLVLTNLGEVYTELGEYLKSIDVLNKSINIFKKLGDKQESFEALFLLAQVYLLINANEEAEKIINDIELIFKTDELSEKQQVHIRYLTLLKNYHSYNPLLVINELIELRNIYFNYGLKGQFLRIHFFLINFLIENDNITEALKELNENTFQLLLRKNKLAAAGYFYYHGKISAINNIDSEHSSIGYYQKAYSLIQNESITELTFNIIFALAESLVERGLINKAKTHIKYAAAVLNFFLDNIKNEHLCNLYLSQKDRKYCFNKLTGWEKLFDV